MRPVLAQLCDNPHLVSHSPTALLALPINQCWKWVHSGKSARADTIYKTKYIVKSDFGDTSSVLNLMLDALATLRKRHADAGTDTKDWGPVRMTQRIMRSAVNKVNGSFVVAGTYVCTR